MKKRENERTLYLRLMNAVCLGGDSDSLCLYHLRHPVKGFGDAAGIACRDPEASAGGSAGGVSAVSAEPQA